MEIFSSVWWLPLQLTLQLMAVSVVISGAVGILGAWAASSIESNGRAGKRLARLFLAAMVAAIAIPMILHAAAWEATAGKFGWLPLTQTGSRSTAIGAFGAFGGLIACGWIHGLVGSAIVALATWHGVRRVPESLIEQSRLDSGPIAVWWRIRLPIAMPWLITSLLGTMALAATEMTVVDLYGYRTIADEFYLFHVSDASTSSILMTCFLPLAIAVTLMMVLLVWRRRLPTFNSHRPGQESAAVVDIEPLPAGWFYLASVIAIVIASFVVVVPIAGLVIKAGHQVIVEGGSRSASWSLDQCIETLRWAPMTFAAEYQWTVILAASTGAVALLLGWTSAAIGRTQRVANITFDLVSLGMVLIPGPIIGLAVVRFFQFDVPGFRVAYQQTLVPTIIALLFRAGPVAYWVMRAGYRGIDDAVIDAARLDRPWLLRVWLIDRPLLIRPLIAAFLASAIVASGDVPATLPVIPPGVTTVGTRLFELLHNGARYQEAALALWYVGAVVIISLLWLRWGAASRAKMV